MNPEFTKGLVTGAFIALAIGGGMIVMVANIFWKGMK